MTRIRVRGGGIIGLACAEELLRRGHDVQVVDRRPGSGASRAAAGMLSPCGEAWYGEPEVHRLGTAGAALWPAYAGRLGVPLHRTGTMLLAHDAGDRERLTRQLDLLAAWGGRVEFLDRAAVRRLEPTATGAAAGAVLPDDHAVDPRAVIAALLTRLRGRVLAEPSGDAELEVLATGARLPAPYAGWVRGVRGEILRVRSDDPPGRVLRGWVRGEQVYVVPRATGEVVVGATMEEHDRPPIVTLEGVERLIRAARTLVPGLDRAELVEASAADRPATPDHLPLIGPAPTDRIGKKLAFRREDPGLSRIARTWLAAGHFRHGVLLAPLTARLIADGIEGAATDPDVDPARFSGQLTEQVTDGVTDRVTDRVADGVKDRVTEQFDDQEAMT